MTNRIFGFVWCIIFTIAAFLPLLRNENPRWIIALVAFLLAFLSVFSPNVLSPLNRAWTRFGKFMHAIISELALFVIYYVVITPGGLLLRIFGWKPISKDFAPTADSYWKSSENQTTDFTRPY